MSAHLMIVAGYLDLPLSHKLTLMKLCDSADDRTRLAYPGLEAVRLWSGTKKSRALEVMKDLQEWGYVMQVEQGRRNRRAVFKVFPDPGDEAFSLAAKKGQACRGAERFAGSPGIPDDGQIAARIAAMDGEKGSSVPDPSNRVQSPGPIANGSDSADPKSPIGSSEPDPNDEKGSDLTGEKGPISPHNGSNLPDPFGTKLRADTTSVSFSSLRDDAATVASDAADSTVDQGETETEREDVERLCSHLADRIEGNGAKRPTVTRKWRDAARLMLDRDARTEDQVHKAIDWCQDDEFWRSNILSMPKLREKYDQLRLQAMRRPASAGQASNVHRDRPAAVSTDTSGMFA